MRPSGRLAVPATAIVAITTLAGCVSLPTSGRVSHTGPPGYNGSEQVVQLVPRLPGQNWGPEEIVMGFLAASGAMLSGGSSSRSVLNSRALDVAKKYLTPKYRKSWAPDPSSLTVLDSSLAGLSLSEPKGAPPPNRVPARIVSVTSNHVETLQYVGPTFIGNIVVSPRKHVFDFSLYEVSRGTWRIDLLPNRLLLTQPDFLRDYQPRDLYFLTKNLAKNKKPYLIPYPAFMPAQAQTQAGAQELANDLLQGGPNGPGPPGWLKEAAKTAFPAGAKISGVEVSGPKATVNLDLPASAKLYFGEVEQMEAQLVWTLTSSPYGGGASGISSVQLVIRHGRSNQSELLLRRNFTSWVPSVGGGPLYFQNLGVFGQPVIYRRTYAHGRPGSTRVRTLAGLGAGLFTHIAVPPGTGPAMLGACRGNVVYLAPPRYRARVVVQTLPSRCTSLSWDDNGNLWATSGITVYVLRPVTRPGGALVRLSSTKVVSFFRRLRATDTVSSFQVAPDGVRAAMIVRSRTGSKVFVAAISTYPGHYFLALSTRRVQVGSEIADPTDLVWQNPDDLLVLGSAVSGGSRYVFQVPLNGQPSVPSSVAVPRGALWLTADSLGVAVGRPGRSAGQIWLLRTWNGNWQQTPVMGSTPDYSG